MPASTPHSLPRPHTPKFVSRSKAIFVPHTPVKDYHFQHMTMTGLSKAKHGWQWSSHRVAVTQWWFAHHITFTDHALLLRTLYKPPSNTTVTTAARSGRDRAVFDTVVPMRGELVMHDFGRLVWSSPLIPRLMLNLT